MKKIYLLLSIFAFSSAAYSCDICGCGLGNYYIGMIPHFNRSFLGVRYQYRFFHTQISNDKTQFSNDRFQTIELWGGFNFGRHWQVLVFVPYNFNNQVSDDGSKKKNGLGDIASLLNYSLIEKSTLNNNNKMIFQKLSIGIGLKAATGASQIDPNATDIVALANSQMGSGSTDFLLTSAYTIRVNEIGFTSNITYKINTANKDKYQFGNRLSSNNFIYYSLKSKNTVLTPNMGILYENSSANKLRNLKVDQTGGYDIMATAGLEASFKKMVVGFNMQSPLSQNFAMGQTQAKIRAMAHVTFAF